MRKFVGMTVALLVVMSSITPALTASADPVACADIELIAARGTSAAPQPPVATDPAEYLDPTTYLGMGPEGYQVFQALLTRATDANETMRGIGLVYPAMSDITEGLIGSDLIPDTAYGDSLDFGAESLKSEVSAQLLACPATQFVLVGYSQGAEAVGRGIDLLSSSEKAAVSATVFFGDPEFDADDVASDRGSFSPSHSGLFDDRGEWSDSISGSPLFSYCHWADIACNSRTEIYWGSRLVAWPIDYAFITGPDVGMAAHTNYAGSDYIDRAVDNVSNVLGLQCSVYSDAPAAQLSGPVKAIAGEVVDFSALGSETNPCAPVDYTWHSGPGATASRGSLRTSGGSPQDVDATGALFTTTFDEPGHYSVSTTVTTDEGTDTATRQVEVVAGPAELPAAPQFSSSLDGEQLTLQWTDPSEAPTSVFNILNGDGIAVDTVTPAGTIQSDGTHFEWVVNNVSSAAAAGYSIAAENALGETRGVLVLPASAAEYIHPTTTNGITTGGTFAISGAGNTFLDATFANAPSESPVSVQGDYSAVFNPSAGASMTYDMSDASATMTLDQSTWHLNFSFGTDVDANGETVTDLMRDGLGTRLLASGTVTISINGSPAMVRIGDDTTTTEVDKYTLGHTAGVPSGVSADGYGGSYVQHDFVAYHNGSYDAQSFPAGSETAHSSDPDYDWSSAVISDVHTYIGNDEVSHTGSLTLYDLSAPDSEDDYSIYIDLAGKIAAGDYQTLRSFVEDGTITFRVDGGALNTMTFDAAPSDAEAAFPTPVAPVILGSDTITAYQYRYLTWQPYFDWGPDETGTYTISPVNMTDIFQSVDGSVIYGTPRYQGTAYIVVTATNATGSTTRTFSLTVQPSFADPKLYLQSGNIQRKSNGTDHILLGRLDYNKPDNANMTLWMPAVQESGLGYELYNSQVDRFDATDFRLYRSNGTQVAVTGTFAIEIDYNQGPGWIWIESNDATIGDNSATTINTLFSSAVRITFRRGLNGALNELWRPGSNPHVS